MSFTLRLVVGGAVLAAAAVILSQAERPPMQSIQRGYRGTGMAEIYNPRLLAQTVVANQVPVALPSLGNSGQRRAPPTRTSRC